MADPAHPVCPGFPGRCLRGAQHRFYAERSVAHAQQNGRDIPYRRRDAEKYGKSDSSPGWVQGKCGAADRDRVLGPGVSREFIHTDIAVETTPDGDLYAAMTGALLAQDPDARVIPYCLSAGTDAKSFSRLGMRCFGFTPLRLPPDLDFPGMFHGVDERVPVDALRFGPRVLDRFLDCC